MKDKYILTAESVTEGHPDISEYVETELFPATENRKRMRGQNDHER